jgi:hypothetical protein
MRPNPVRQHVPSHEEIKDRHKNKLSSKKNQATSEYFNPFVIEDKSEEKAKKDKKNRNSKK